MKSMLNEGWKLAMVQRVGQWLLLVRRSFTAATQTQPAVMSAAGTVMTIVVSLAETIAGVKLMCVVVPGSAQSSVTGGGVEPAMVAKFCPPMVTSQPAPAQLVTTP